jgi:TonB family protein
MMYQKLWTALLALITVTACQPAGEKGKIAFDASVRRPDVLPVMLNKDLPFRYPPALYAEKVQGNVTLRLFIDENGSVVSDSTNVVESSNTPLLDSAAVKGARELKFIPAKLRGTPMAVAILFPVYFRHPEVKPPPEDTMLTPVNPSNGTPNAGRGQEGVKQGA